MMVSHSHVGNIVRKPFGKMPTGAEVEAITLGNRRSVSATIITLGASLQSLMLPDKDGARTDIALGHATLEEYLDKRQYLGATVGRVANRIAAGRFELGGKLYQITTNEGHNTLHGGDTGFDQAVWEVRAVDDDDDYSEVVLCHVSPDGDQGFPGRVEATVRYRLTRNNELQIEHSATSDRPTVVSLSNHAYWNLAGEGAAQSAMSLELLIKADRYLPIDSQLIPTGELRGVKGTVFDFREPRVIGERVRYANDDQIRIARGYDHNWVVTERATPDLHLMAKVKDAASGRAFELWSDQPGLQFYSGNFLDGTSSGKAGQLYRQGDAIALEPQAFPDTVNQPTFGSALLRPGELYKNRITYRFSCGND